MLYLCEFELFEEEDMIVVFPFGLPGATQGYDLRDAAEMAYDWLRLDGEVKLMMGKELPKPPLGNKPQHGGTILLVGAEVSLDNVEKVTASEAARMLGVSRSRVSQMLNTDLLMGYRNGRDTYITLDSIRARLAERPKAGRPKKKLVAEREGVDRAGTSRAEADQEEVSCVEMNQVAANAPAEELQVG